MIVDEGLMEIEFNGLYRWEEYLKYFDNIFYNSAI